MTEDYVSYEVAKLLKEKGFLKDVDLRMTQNLSFYDNIGLSHNLNKWYDSLIQDKIDFVVAPTHQMTMKWLREVHQLHISIKPTWALGDMREPCRWEYDIINLATTADPMYYVGKSTYEEAVEAACIYALKNLL